MAINFPSSPTTGDTYVYFGDTYRWDGTHWTSIGGNNPGVVRRVYTANTTWTPSPGMLYADIECVGGGGGGGGAAGTANYILAAGGGGGGAYSRKLVTTTTVGASQTVTVGTGGTGGAAGANPGNAGNDTSVGSICLAKGGAGAGGINSATAPGRGLGGVASSGTGDIKVDGGTGFGVWYSIAASATDVRVSSVSGGSVLGGSFATPLMSGTLTNGETGRKYGGGGTGAITFSTAGGASGTGGTGADGIVIITEFIGLNTTPLTTVDDSVPRFSGTAGIIQTSNVFITDAGDLNVGAGLQIGSLIGAGDAAIEIGQYRTANGNAYIDFHSQTGSDADFRIIKASGVDGVSQISDNGVGGMYIGTLGTLNLLTNAVTRIAISTAGVVNFSQTPTLNSATLAGANLIASGSLSGTATIIANIPQTFAYIYLQISGASTNGTDQILVQIDDTADGSSPITSASNYANYNITGTTIAAGAVASIAPATTILAAQLSYINAAIFAYNLTATDMNIHYAHSANAVVYRGQTTYNAAGPCNALVIKGSAGGTFDAGQYFLYGMR